MRSKKAIKNMVASIGYELVAVICGLILPRLILSTFGSSYNGITSSITQFLACAAILKAGIGGVTRAALYKPLAKEDTKNISAIINATSKFMKKIALILLFFMVIFACIYPLFVRYDFDWLFSFSLVLILGISTFMQYYFGIAYQMLLEADQKQYILSCVQIFTTILNTILAVILIKIGANIHLVKLGSAFAFSLNPFILNIYVNKKYKIDKSVPANNEALNQRWDAFWQSVAFFIHNNTDTIVLTIFSGVKMVSVYTVYNYVISNIRNVAMTFVTGFGAAFGNMLAKKEFETAEKNLRVYELIIFNLVSIIYTTAGIMIVPFALLYTSGVNDISYERPLFAFIAVLAGTFSCYRVPYQSVVEAAGHFKQTKNGAFIEAILNIVISVMFVTKFGLVGVAIGTLVATIFRSVQYSTYLSKNIIKRNNWHFWKHILINGIIALLTYVIVQSLVTFNLTNYGLWALKATVVIFIASVLTIMFDIIFYDKDTKILLSKIKNILKKNKNV